MRERAYILVGTIGVSRRVQEYTEKRRGMKQMLEAGMGRV
jgi:hypothetical protein